MNLLIALCIALLWGISPLLRGQVVNTFGIENMLSFEVVFTFIMGLVMYKNYLRKVDLSLITNKQFILLMGGIVLIVVIVNILYSKITALENGYIFIAVTSTYPLFSTAILLLSGKVKPNLPIYLGILLVVVGVTVLIIGSTTATKSSVTTSATDIEQTKPIEMFQT